MYMYKNWLAIDRSRYVLYCTCMERVWGGIETRSVAVFKLCGFESWYRINFGSEESVRNEMDVPDTEIVDALPQ